MVFCLISGVFYFTNIFAQLPKEEYRLPYSELIAKYPGLGVRASEDLLWLKLTGKTKDVSIVSNLSI